MMQCESSDVRTIDSVRIQIISNVQAMYVCKAQ